MQRRCDEKGENVTSNGQALGYNRFDLDQTVARRPPRQTKRSEHPTNSYIVIQGSIPPKTLESAEFQNHVPPCRLSSGADGRVCSSVWNQIYD